ncbi:MAG: hypothetical protein KAR06_02465 [Deltaproteobacteria bacterium]|nr:hypothetical protein [Deltaproteobacteria bacterium]
MAIFLRIDLNMNPNEPVAILKHEWFVEGNGEFVLTKASLMARIENMKGLDVTQEQVALEALEAIR